ncbi:hypothetical protein RIF29_38693 [Crotalaria pallida]|uniref:Uncharacterized protein n=1 Tax=Crotalaria pallida TaxID=3830 RepID=A0AAN9E587_CROPI
MSGGSIPAVGIENALLSLSTLSFLTVNPNLKKISKNSSIFFFLLVSLSTLIHSFVHTNSLSQSVGARSSPILVSSSHCSRSKFASLPSNPSQTLKLNFSFALLLQGSIGYW